MEPQIIKSKPLSKDESKALLELIEMSKIIISKATNASSNKMKDKEWVRIAEQFNATATSCRQTPQQLRLKWENLKKNARKRCTKIRMNSINTGGGVGEYIPPDEILDRVTSLLGNTASGLVVPYGGDREPEHFVVISDGGGIVPNGNGVEELGGDARVNLEILEFQDTPVPDPQKKMVVTPTSSHSAMAQVNTYAVAEQNKVSDTPRRVTFNVPKTGKRKLQGDGSKSARDRAIAEYYTFKKLCLESKLENIKLENKKLKLENEKLLLEIENFKK
ncbi:unnamed protein product [Parnassius apollo]|uniref:Regulatory protein zeste n=1 Tax=Parnassius apollo TaxID=110799 RepID=A0A8S3Y6J0_PARAO|nr:unnamed protein product [Parnassius apollo]